MIRDSPTRPSRAENPLVLVLVAGIFTILGAVLAVALDRLTERHVIEELRKQEAAVLIATRAQSRWFRSQMVVQAVDSSLFPDRWELYIREGLVPWNDDYLLILTRIRQYFPEAEQDFDQLQVAFEDLQGTLLAYWRRGGSPPKPTRDRAEDQLRSTKKQVDALTKRILTDT